MGPDDGGEPSRGVVDLSSVGPIDDVLGRRVDRQRGRRGRATAAARAGRYAASKAGLIALARSIALDYAAAGIRSNCVCPGPTETPMFVNDKANIRAREDNGGAWARPLGAARGDRPGRPAVRLARDAHADGRGTSHR